MKNSLDTVRPSLLLVEDDRLLGEALRSALTKRGYEVEVCPTRREALARVAAQPFKFGVVDLRLPDGSGLCVVQALRRAGAATAIVVLTGYANIATAVEAIKLGATNYLCKPVTAEALVSGLQQSAGSCHGTLAEPPLSVLRLEWQHIMRVCAEHQNNISATARALGMHRRTLQRKLSKHTEEESSGSDA
jgi:two-component system, response regulator RegA